jgi:hypothetical protein
VRITPRTLLSPPGSLAEFAVTSAIYESAWLATYYGLGRVLAPPVFAGHSLGPQLTYSTFRKLIYSGAGLAVRSAAPAIPFVGIVSIAAATGFSAAKQGHTTTPFGGNYFKY